MGSGKGRSAGGPLRLDTAYPSGPRFW